IKVGKIDSQNQDLLRQDRPGQGQDLAPGRQRRVGQWRVIFQNLSFFASAKWMITYNIHKDARPSLKSWMWVHPPPHKKQGVPPMTDLFDEIAVLKTRENATILAHYYQDGEIQQLADFTGDSLKLARAATTVKTGTIVFCGVHFMAETAKMLNPD